MKSDGAPELMESDRAEQNETKWNDILFFG